MAQPQPAHHAGGIGAFGCLEGVAYNARWLFEPYEKFLGQRVGQIRILGGGAQSDLWCQIMADVLDRPLSAWQIPE